MRKSFREQDSSGAVTRRDRAGMPGMRRPGGRGPHQRRGMLLLVVLVIISVLALIAANFAFRMTAERMGAEALGDLQQARLAADSGLARVLLLLRDDRTNMDQWYSNPEAFRRVPVWMPSDTKEGIGGTESPISKEVVENQPAWRYSVVAYEQLNEEQVVMRYGLIDEAGKLNLNFASRGELLRLVSTLDLEDTPPEALVDCLIDWRDKDSSLTTPAGAETPWYMMLSPNYRAKNRPFESVDELLMVKNWNGRFLYGEDYNRNGYLDENEDDGEEGAFPPDDGDGELLRGLSRLITVYSWDWNFANDNKPRSDINGMNWAEPEKLPQELQDELGQEVIDFLAQAKERGFKFRSVGELWGLEVYEDGSSNYDDAWDEYRAQVKEENAIPKSEDEESGENDEQQGPDAGEGEEDGEGQDGGEEGDDRDNADDRDEERGGDESGEGQEDDRDGGRGGRNRSGDNGRGGRSNDDAGQDEDPQDDRADGPSSLRDRKAGRQNQAVRAEENGERNGAPGRGRGGAGAQNDRADEQDEAGDDNGRGGRNRQGGRNRDNDEDGEEQGGEGRGRQDGSGRDGERDGRDDSGENEEDPESQPGEDDEERKGTPIVSPVTPEQMNIVMDRLTAVNSAVRVGQINVNTAPVEVLQSLIGITAEEAKGIVERRRGMAGPDKMTPAWLVTGGALSPEKFAVLSNKLTARSIQFTADIVGFADHVGTFRRVQATIEMRGHMAQVRYYRDISSLGMGFPVKDDERSEGLAFGNQ